MATISSTRAVPDTAQSHPYSCNTCQVAFRNIDLQKGHMKSDWHRYNLKRRVASLPPITSETFTEKVLQARAETSAKADKAGFERSCAVCQKTYYSENSYQNHLGSQKHKAKALAAAPRKPDSVRKVVDDEASSIMSSTFSLGEPIATDGDDEVDSEAEEEFNQVVEGLQKTNLRDARAGISPVKRPSNPHLSAQAQHMTDHPMSSMSSSENQSTEPTPSATPAQSKADGQAADLKHCLFCNYSSPTVPLNIHHMERIHGLFIPERKYLVDLEGLIKALQKRIFDLHECIYCGKAKSDVYAVQAHMRDIGHCQIPYTTEAEQVEIGEFYDFRSTYSDHDDDSETDSDNVRNRGAKLGAHREATTRNADGDVIMSDEAGEDGWETDSSASSLDSDDLTAVPMEQHNFNQYERLDQHPHHSRDDPRAHHQLDGWHSHGHRHNHAVFYDEYELHLPSGKSIGHRSLNRYFRQNLHSHPSPAERQQLAIEAAEAEDEDEDAMSVDAEAQQVAQRQQAARNHHRAVVTRANGGLGMLGVAKHKKHEAKQAEQRGRSLKEFSKKRNEWTINKQANHQKYYNYQIL
jgi:pre-60S factor REI1